MTNQLTAPSVSPSRARSLANLRPGWKPGQSGNPYGRPKVLTDEIRRRLSEPETVRQIVDSCIARARAGSIEHLRFLADRTEGLLVKEVRVETRDVRKLTDADLIQMIESYQRTAIDATAGVPPAAPQKGLAA